MTGASKSAGPTVPALASDGKATPPPLRLPPYLSVKQMVGRGAYGEVYLCDDSRDSTQVAVKLIRDFTKEPVCGKRILREIRLLAALRHENLLRLVDLLPVPHPDFDDVYIVMPYMHLDLHKVIYSKMKLSDNHKQAFICQILRGLKYLHSAGVVHRDLKPSNVLVNKDCTLKVADFGLARGRANDEEELTTYVATRWYRAPELILVESAYFEAVDIWSAGCIHMELLARQPLFPGKDHVDMLRRIASALGFSFDRDLVWVAEKERERIKSQLGSLSLPETPDAPLEERVPNASESCLDLVRKLLDKVPTQRPSADAALDHPHLRHLHDIHGETTAPRQFGWDFDRFVPTARSLKDRVYAECAKLHPEIVARDAEWLQAHGFLPREGTAPLGPLPAKQPKPTSSQKLE